MQMTRYYKEFLRYSFMAQEQQEQSNLGKIPHLKSRVRDPLMKNVHLFDVVERRYAGFTQILHDMIYAKTRKHPYHGKLHAVRAPIAKNFSGWWSQLTLPTQLYVFLVHRLTGSGINYAKSPSGYHNTVLPEFYRSRDIRGMARIIREYEPPKYTSIGYQFPAFPKPKSPYERGGDYFMCEMLPKLAKLLAVYLTKGQKKDLRQVGEFMFAWNRSMKLRVYYFQYSAVIADICDFFPEFVNRESPFYYGSNAIECIKYMADSPLKGDKYRDAVMERAMEDTGHFPYNLEDQMCDCIRWIENYIRPGHDYEHLDRDKIWSSCRIKDHPFGRQKAMLELGLVKSFNDIAVHPSDNYVISRAGLSVDDYKKKVAKL